VEEKKMMNQKEALDAVKEYMLKVRLTFNDIQ
jgi:hypothetical protein